MTKESYLEKNTFQVLKVFFFSNLKEPWQLFQVLYDYDTHQRYSAELFPLINDIQGIKKEKKIHNVGIFFISLKVIFFLFRRE